MKLISNTYKMKRYNLLIILSSLIALLSCEKINYMYYLEKDSNITFDLNYDVEPYIKALFPYTDKDLSLIHI